MSDSERVERAAALLERLVLDAEFRARFRAQPEAACREAGLDDVADEIRMGGGALQTLEVRESKSSLLGVVMAAALEGVGVLELSHMVGGGALTGDAAHAAHLASTRAGMKAVRPAAARAGIHLPHAPRAPHLPHAPHVAHAAGAAPAAPPAGAPADPAAAAPPAPAAPAVDPAAAGTAPADPSAAAGAAPAAPGDPSAAAPAGTAPVASAASAPPAGGTADAGWGTPEGSGAQGGGWPDAPGAGGQPPQAVAAAADAAAASPGAAPAAADAAAASAGAPAAGTDPISQLVGQQRLTLPDGVDPTAYTTNLDPRLAPILETLAAKHQLGLKAIDGHGVDIATVDGLPVGPDNPAAREIITDIAALGDGQRPTQVGAPWAVSAPGFFSDAAHQDHINLSFGAAGGAPASGTIQFTAVPDPSAQGATGAAAPAPAAAPAAADAATQQPAGGGAVAHAADAAASAPSGGGGFDVAAAGRDYPGDGASKAQIARWMGDWAQRAGLPRELPVMASLVESGLTNVQGGDRDSMGFFQMRTSIWSGPYPDFQHHPEKQLGWFISHALEIKAQHAGATPSQYGNWIADVERPAAEYRGRYQLRLSEAQSLLAQGGGGGAAPAAPQAAAASLAPAAPVAHAAGAAPAAPAGGGGAVNHTISFHAVPPPADQVVPGAPAAAAAPLLPGSSITAPGTAPHELREIFERAATLDRKRMPYLWGGGHQGGVVDVNTTAPLDCSGSVSAVLGIDTRVSGAFESWGAPGPGQHVTVYANAEHVLMEINGHFFGTSAANPGGGAGWIPREHISPNYLAAFTARHPPGL